LFQLRSGHAPLTGHLHCIRKLDSPVCPACREGTETVIHFLVTCRAYAAARAAHFGASGACGRDVNYLLGNAKALKRLFAYVNATWRFHATFGSV
ncbi:hypothetical protein C8Q77DRAFT_1024413, partial [Trametes polyzona]